MFTQYVINANSLTRNPVKQFAIYKLKLFNVKLLRVFADSEMVFIGYFSFSVFLRYLRHFNIMIHLQTR